MKSKITIEIDHDNQPVILINYEPSPDVRDSLVKRFLESFGGESSYASFRFVCSPEDKPNSLARLRPIIPSDLQYIPQCLQEDNLLSNPNGGADFLKKHGYELLPLPK